jgi:hypothetical protein
VLSTKGTEYSSIKRALDATVNCLLAGALQIQDTRNSLSRFIFNAWEEFEWAVRAVNIASTCSNDPLRVTEKNLLSIKCHLRAFDYSNPTWISLYYVPVRQAGDEVATARASNHCIHLTFTHSRPAQVALHIDPTYPATIYCFLGIFSLCSCTAAIRPPCLSYKRKSVYMYSVPEARRRDHPSLMHPTPLTNL